MLDKRTGALLNALNALCENGAYKILSMEDILEKMPTNLYVAEEDVRNGLSALREREFIRVKYEDEREFCLCTLPKGRFIYESKNEEREEEEKTRRKCFIYGFFGALVGGLFAALAAALVLLFV
ncbi:MAG: hypothetical protein DBX59_07940 [Bacillota bacterium]|nr:MAG: hypothetical protein DBX59_07940 [Bacillota bacterium]